MIFIPPTPSRIELTLLRFAVETDYLDYVMPSFGRAIAASKDRISSAELSGPEEYLEAVVDEECALIEDVLSISFVACQTKIYKVISAVEKAHEWLNRKSKVLSNLPRSPDDIMKLDELLFAGASISRVQLIHATANYVKHHDQWKSASWDSLTQQEEKTAAILRASGMKPGSTGNLRTAAKVLGNTEYHKTQIFADIVDEWAVKILELADVN